MVLAIKEYTKAVWKVLQTEMKNTLLNSKNTLFSENNIPEAPGNNHLQLLWNFHLMYNAFQIKNLQVWEHIIEGAKFGEYGRCSNNSNFKFADFCDGVLTIVCLILLKNIFLWCKPDIFSWIFASNWSRRLQ